MKASEIIKTEGIQLVRMKKIEHKPGTPYQYDVKDAFTGSKKGFVYLDAFTKSAMLQVYNALNDNQKALYDNISMKRLVDFTWKVVV